MFGGLNGPETALLLACLEGKSRSTSRPARRFRIHSGRHGQNRSRMAAHPARDTRERCRHIRPLEGSGIRASGRVVNRWICCHRSHRRAAQLSDCNSQDGLSRSGRTQALNPPSRANSNIRRRSAPGQPEESRGHDRTSWPRSGQDMARHPSHRAMKVSQRQGVQDPDWAASAGGSHSSLNIL